MATDGGFILFKPILLQELPTITEKALIPKKYPKGRALIVLTEQVSLTQKQPAGL